jgi:2-polyprenyl-3-methyl-5-hydroxy-6-metoxy-1,4-benzoquinol methylase
MDEETVRKLDADALELFARKGKEGGPSVPQAGLANGVKVRRIMQISRDLASKPFDQLRILSLGCGEGVYAIEAGLRGAEVVAVDARTQRMEQGAACAKRHGLTNVHFVQDDVRNVTRESFGSFDLVFFLGLLYHLDVPDVFSVLERIYVLCDGMLLIDTLISLQAREDVEWRGTVDRGERFREHDDGDTAEVRRSRVLRSIDNTFSFRFSRESLLAALHDVGFSSAYECHLPFEAGKAGDRITLVARKGIPVLLSTYPWVNGKTDGEIEQELKAAREEAPPNKV